MKKLQISIIIPTYNEKDNIRILIPALREVLRSLPQYHYELIIVDDDSPDGTGPEAKEIFKNDLRVKIFVRKNESGLGTAIRYGIEKASGDIIIGMDGDFNHDPEAIPNLLTRLQTSQFVIASRFIPGGGMTDRVRFHATKVFNVVLRLAFGFPSSDNTSGYYAIRKKDLLKIGLESIYYGYGDYHLRLVYFVKRGGYSISEVPVFYRKRVYGQSKSKLPEMAVGYLKEAIRLRFLVPREMHEEKAFTISNH